MSKVGRNDPCPCGSGQKYKKCCLGKNEVSLTSDIPDELGESSECDYSPSIIEEAKEYTAEYLQQCNNEPRDYYHGLSMAQMTKILDCPFESPDVVTFPECLDIQPSGPAVLLFQMLADAICDNGLKPTATGNLPRKFLQDSASVYYNEEGYLDSPDPCSIRKECDFPEMSVVKTVALQSGLIRRYKGMFILGQKYRKLISKHGMAGVYPVFLDAYMRLYNWCYADAYAETSFFQQSFLYTMYLLNRYGNEWHPNSFYEDAFMMALPGVHNHFREISEPTSEETVRKCYRLRVLTRFAQFLGLIEVKHSDDMFDSSFSLKKRPLLDSAIVFHLADM